MRYYEIAPDFSMQELDEGWMKNAAKLAAAGATAATLGYGAGVASNMSKMPTATQQSTNIKNTPVIPNTKSTGYTTTAPAKPSVDVQTPDKNTIRPKPRPDGVQTPDDSTIRPQPRPKPETPKSELLPVDPSLQAAVDARSKVDNVSVNVEQENQLRADAEAAGITGVELQAFLAQCAHESADFTRMKENGSKRYFQHNYDIRYAPKTAAKLGNTEPGDGYKYRGRGYLQLTGKENYARAGKALGLPLVEHPELAEDPKNAALIAVWFWKTRVQPNVENWNDVEQVTHKINPNDTNMDARQDKFDAYKKLKL